MILCVQRFPCASLLFLVTGTAALQAVRSRTADLGLLHNPPMLR